MTKTVVRYFFDFVDGQEKWLNKMSLAGYRLVDCGNLTYKFESGAPGEYAYAVELVADKSNSKAKDYRRFLEDAGFRTFTKNINLNFSVGKARWRPWADASGQVSTSPGSYNKELLIVEKKSDGKPFDLHTDMRELSALFVNIRNSYLMAVLLLTFFGIAGFTSLISMQVWSSIAFCAAGVMFILPAAKYAGIARRYKQESKTNE